MPEFPWEDFQTTNTVVAEGPWMDFAPKAKKTREQVMASIGPSSESEVPLMTRIGAAMVAPIDVIRRMEPINAVKEAMMGLTELGRGNVRQALMGPPSPEVQTRFNMPVVSPETAQKAVEFFSPGGRASEGSVGQGVQQFLGDLASGLTTFEGMGGLASGRISPLLPAVQFGGGMIRDVPEAITALQNAQGGAETTKAGLRLGLDVAGPFGLARVSPEAAPKSSGLTRMDIPSSLVDIPLTREMSREYLDMVENQRRAVQGYSVLPRREAQQPPVVLGQQPPPRQVFFAPPEQPIVAGQGPTIPPVEPSGGEISFRGQGIPSARQTAEFPKQSSEQEALMRGMYVPSAEKLVEPQPKPQTIEDYASTIRSTQEEVPQSGNVRSESGGTRSENPQRVGEQRGGTEGLRNEGIRQEAQKPEVARLGSSTIKNQFGDPIATSYYGTPEDVAAYQDIETRMAAESKKGVLTPQGDVRPEIRAINLEREALKNKYGGMPPLAKPESPRLYSVPSMFFDPEFYKKTGQGVKQIGAKLGEYFKGAEDKVLPVLDFDTKNPLPDLQAKDVANKIFSQPFASEKIPVLGRLMGGKARIRTPQDEAIATWYAERHGVGPAIASNLGELLRGKVSSAFKVSENGDLNVGKTAPGQSLKMSDVFEALRKNPSSYQLTPAQQQVVKTVIEPVTKRMTELAKKYDLIDEVVDESGDFKPYFPRIVTEHPKIEDKTPTSAFKTRAFATEKEGWERGYKYETDPEKRLVSGVNRLYRAIANQRLASDPILGAKSEAQIKADLQDTFAEEIGSGAMTQKKIDRIAEGIRTRGQVMQPILIRKIFDQKTAQMLNKEFAAEQSNVRNAISSANSLVKALSLGFDLGVGQIQMLPMLYKNPRIWGEAQFKSLQSMASPQFFAEYARQNQGPIRELAQMGSSVGRLQEMMVGLGKGQPLSKVPGVGQVGEAFGRQFQTALDVAKVELWKALRETAPKEEWPKLVRSIETTLLSGRMESAMVPHGRSLLERVALLAPSYYRGAVDSIAGLAERGASGKQVRDTMGRFIVGGLLTYYAVSKMVGMSNDQIEERLNPARADFLMWAIKQEDGSVVNLGFGGIHRSLLRLAGNMVKTSIEHPENWKSLSSEKNPLSRWYRGHAGPVPGLTWEGVSGKDFLGRESDVTSMGVRVLPLAIQQAVTGKGEAPAKPIEYVASSVGMSAIPESFSARRAREVDAVSQAKFGKSFEQLSLGQRRSVEANVDKKLAGVPKGMSPEKSRELAERKEDERLAALKAGLQEGTIKWIEASGIKVRNYQTTKEIGKVGVHLTETEREALQKNMIEEYQQVFDRLQSNPRINGLSLSDKQRYVDVNLEIARKRAWAKTMRVVGKPQSPQP